MCPRTLSDRYDQTETDRVLCFFLLDHNGQTKIYRLEKLRFSDRGKYPQGYLGLRAFQKNHLKSLKDPYYIEFVSWRIDFFCFFTNTSFIYKCIRIKDESKKRTNMAEMENGLNKSMA